jgi:hypothetical protein
MEDIIEDELGGDKDDEWWGFWMDWRSYRS